MINNAVIVRLSSIMVIRRKASCSGVEITLNSGDVLVVTPPIVGTPANNPIWDDVVEALELVEG